MQGCGDTIREHDMSMDPISCTLGGMVGIFLGLFSCSASVFDVSVFLKAVNLLPVVIFMMLVQLFQVSSSLEMHGM